ncbi:hypothetical protein DPEC_G00345870 [Dallia pectoralis]|uniref:Uncharacterized protein n=1 Tax=Dallia pectoralis TaxID=75939 RepID=A0ACC2F3T4_DALPE|nr:hypothetical protein DPEC_G00345870 [Dallia pectoralis]
MLDGHITLNHRGVSQCEHEGFVSDALRCLRSFKLFVVGKSAKVKGQLGPAATQEEDFTCSFTSAIVHPGSHPSWLSSTSPLRGLVILARTDTMTPSPQNKHDQSRCVTGVPRRIRPSGTTRLLV